MSTNGIDPSKLFSVEANSQDILVLIRKYLLHKGLQSTAATLHNECALLKKSSKQALKIIRDSVAIGDWDSLRDVAKSPICISRKFVKGFTFLVNRQEFFELVNKHESLPAFNHLIRRLKPFEKEAKSFGNDFRDLCYLATCRSVTDSPVFRSWEGIALSRERLIKELERMVVHIQDESSDDVDLLDFIDNDDEDDFTAFQEDLTRKNKPVRLVSLLQQAYAYQIEKKHVSSSSALFDVPSLLVDFSLPAVPLAKGCITLAGHLQSVKCIEFVPNSPLLASAGGDSDVLVWNASHPSSTPILRGQGHISRVWDLSASYDGSFLASVSADSTLRVWNVEVDPDETFASSLIDSHHQGDIYSVSFHPSTNTHLVTSGHDKSARLIDVETQTAIKVFHGHTGSVIQSVFNPFGNVLVTGSKDSTVKFFDLVSGVCIKTLPALLGEVTSVQFSPLGDKLLTGSKDSTCRLWDIRNNTVPVSKFKGHVNSSKSFIRAQFGSTEKVILSGSENGVVHVWNADNGEILERLLGHRGSVFRTSWNHHLSVLGSCSEDGTIRIWKS